MTPLCLCCVTITLLGRLILKQTTIIFLAIMNFEVFFFLKVFDKRATAWETVIIVLGRMQHQTSYLCVASNGTYDFRLPVLALSTLETGSPLYLARSRGWYIFKTCVSHGRTREKPLPIYQKLWVPLNHIVLKIYILFCILTLSLRKPVPNSGI